MGLFLSSIFGPAVILLVMIGSVLFTSQKLDSSSEGIPTWIAIVINVVPLTIFSLLCFYASDKITVKFILVINYLLIID